MQRLGSFGLMGVAREAVAPLSTVAAAAIVAAERNTPAPAARRPVVAGRKPAAASRTRTAARGEGGIRWISETRANGGNLPPGRYQYRDSSGRVHYRDVGELACRQSLRERRLHRGDITGGFSDREIRDGVAVRSAGRFKVVV